MRTPGEYLDKHRNNEAFAEMDRRKGKVVDPNATPTPFEALDEARRWGDVSTRADRAKASEDRNGVSSNPRGLIGGEYATRRGRGAPLRKRIAGVTREQAEAGMNAWRHSNDDAFAEMNRRKMPGGSAGPKAKPQPAAKAQLAGQDLFGPEPKVKIGSSQPSTDSLSKERLNELYEQATGPNSTLARKKRQTT